MDSTPELIPDLPQPNGITIPDSNTDSPQPPRSTPSKKGFGLKKWRRIPRYNPNRVIENDKDRDSDSDSTAGRVLKRGSENHATPPVINDLFESAGAGDSDYSEDGGTSKSSTAASAPKFQGRGSRDKNFKGKGQRVMVSKKAMDDGEFDKGSSPISSFESDSRSCNSVFVSRDRFRTDAPNVVVGAGSPPSEEQSAQQGEGCVAECSDQLSSSVNQDNCKVGCQIDSDSNGDGDPLVDSTLLLQSAQLALQAEVQKFVKIGKGICSLYDDSDKTNGVAVDAVVHMANCSMCDGCVGNGNFSNTVQTLERQLNEAECSLKDKEMKIAELETTLRSVESSQDHVKSTMEQLYKRCTEMEIALQVLFRQKLEAEVLSVVMTGTSKDLSVLVKDHSLLAKEEMQSPGITMDAENKDAQPEKSDTLYSGEEILEMCRGVNKLSKCFVIQLFLLFFVIALSVFQLALKPAAVVPT